MQAINVNLIAVIFIPLRDQFGLTYAQFGTLVLVNFIAQLAVNIAVSKALDRVGMKPFIMPSLCACVCGLLLFALTPTLFPSNVYAGFMASTLLIALGGGLLELCLSPIVDAIPSDAADSSKALSFLHSFYAWGQAAVVLITTGLLFMGTPWRLIVVIWAAVPVAVAVLFARASIAERAIGDEAMPVRKLFRVRIFIIALIAICCGGAAESTIAQYASSYMEKGLGMAKVSGDILGLCGFAVFLGIGRLIYGLLGDKFSIHMALICGSALSFAAYMVIVFTPAGAPAVIAIALCGLFVSLLWPGTLAVTSNGLPAAGASMFALLAASGSLGCSLGPWVDGLVTDFAILRASAGAAAGNAAGSVVGEAMGGAMGGAVDAAVGAASAGGLAGMALSAEQFGLRAGLLAGAFFPLASLIFQVVLKKESKLRRV